MNEPQFEYSAPQEPARRPILGWLSVLVVLLILTMQQFAGYMDRSAPSELPDITELDGRLKTIVKGPEFESTLKEQAGVEKEPRNGRPEVDEAVKRQLAELAKDIEPFRKKENSYALLYTIVQFERGLEPEESDLAALSKDDGKRRAAAAKIYGADSLTKAQAENWTKPFNSKMFVDKLVKIHAHEKAGDFEFRRKTLRKGGVSLVLAAGMLALAFLGGCILLIAYLVMRSLGHWKPMGHPAGSLTFAQADGNAMRTTLMLVGLFGGQILVSILMPIGAPRELKSVFAFAISLGIAYYALRSPIHGHRMTLEQIGIHKRDLGANVLWGIGAALANLPILLISALLGKSLERWFPEAHHPIQDEISRASPALLFMLFIGAAVFAPIFEETVFRGTFLPALTKKFGSPFMGIVTCGICFAIIHPTGIPAWPPLAVLGMMMAHLTYQRRSLVPAIVMHAVHNGSILAFSLIALS